MHKLQFWATSFCNFSKTFTIFASENFSNVLVRRLSLSLPNYVSYVPCALHTFVLDVPLALLASVPHVSRALPALVPHVPCALRAFVLHLLCVLHVVVPQVPPVPHVPLVPPFSAYCFACFTYQYQLLCSCVPIRHVAFLNIFFQLVSCSGKFTAVKIKIVCRLKIEMTVSIN